jgi:AMP-polyphosphate phosphotransferase
MLQDFQNRVKISKKEYDERVPRLRHELIEAQFAIREAGIPMIIIMAGVEGAGKGEVVNRINAWMDPRGIETHVFRKETEEMKKRPFYWRFWNVMPSAGDIAIFFGSWYSAPMNRMVNGKPDEDRFQEDLQQIRFQEEMLSADGTLFVKLWLHISKSEQGSRLKELEENAATRWRVDESDWKHHNHYERFVKNADKALEITGTEANPWHVVDATRKRDRDLKCMEAILAGMKRALKNREVDSKSDVRKSESRSTAPIKSSVLGKADLTKKLTKQAYDSAFKELSVEIEYLSWQCYQKEISSVFVFEGWDAAGKGGAIRRLTSSMDAKLYRVIQIAAPTDVENAHHYLWRFWKHIPADGKITIYDRSWYGRILVERVEGFARREEWERAYDEICNFEKQLVEHGTVVEKFWLQISSKEQKLRFKDRSEVDFKRYKLTDDDWRNREKRTEYEDAVEEMLARTDFEEAPWNIISAEDKLNARIEVLTAVRDGLKEAMDR